MDLIAHMRDHIRRTEKRTCYPPTATWKYDQFMHHNGEMTLLDFDYFAIGETSYDLGKYCAYTMAVVAEELAGVRGRRRNPDAIPEAIHGAATGADPPEVSVYEALQARAARHGLDVGSAVGMGADR